MVTLSVFGITPTIIGRKFLPSKEVGYDSEGASTNYSSEDSCGESSPPASPHFKGDNVLVFDDTVSIARKKKIEKRVENAVHVAYELSAAVESEDVDNTVKSLQKAATMIQDYKCTNLVLPHVLEVLSTLLENDELMTTTANILRILANILETQRFTNTVSTSCELIAKSFENQTVSKYFQSAVSAANKVIENETIQTHVSKGVSVAKKFYESDSGQQISTTTLSTAKTILANNKVKSSLKMANTMVADPRIQRVSVLHLHECC